LPAVMAEQCGHLAILAERPNISLHITPEGANVGLWGAFDIAARDSAITVRLETVEDMTSTAPGLVGKVTVAFERILGAALPRAESLVLIREIMHRFALLPWVMKTGSLPRGRVRAGRGPGFARWSGWRWPGRKVHSGGGVPPVVTVHAWTVRGRKRVQLPGPPGG
jgi:uncharacterized protein DUF5753